MCATSKVSCCQYGGVLVTQYGVLVTQYESISDMVWVLVKQYEGICDVVWGISDTARGISDIVISTILGMARITL